jgi:hypothetical protein
VDREIAPRLAVSLGPPLDGVRAELRVAVGEKADRDRSAHYALVAPPGEAAAALAEAITLARSESDPDGEDA